MHHKIRTVKAMPGFALKAVFHDGEERVYAVSRLFAEIPEFKAFPSMPGLFEQAKIDPTGYAVVWNDELDLASEEIYTNGTKITQ